MLSVLIKENQNPDTYQLHRAMALAMRRLKQIESPCFLSLSCCFIWSVNPISTGVIASDWNKEVAVSYAPPTFIGADTEALQSTEAVEAMPENPVDPLKDVIRELNTEIAAEQGQVVQLITMVLLIH
jgi:peptide/nickel transport system permease protein